MNIEVCPICKLPAQRHVDGKAVYKHHCTFFARVKDRTVPNKAEAFEAFHSDICPTCRMPVDECKARRVRIAKAKMRKDGLAPEEAFAAQELKTYLKDVKCRVPCFSDEWFHILPEWWKGEKVKK